MADFEVRQTNGEDVRLVTFIGKMVISYAHEMKAAMVEAFARAREIRLDLGEVTEIDLTGMQLVCAAHRDSINMKKAFHIVGNPGEVFTALAADAGFPRHGCMHGEKCPWCGGGD